MAESKQPPDRDWCAPGQLYRDLVEDAVVGVYIATVDGRFLYANRAAASLLGYATVDELASSGVEALYRDPHQRQVLVRKLAEAGEVKDYEIDIVTPQGEPRRVSVNVTLSGQTMRGMLLDITEQRRTEDALRKSEERFRVLFERLADAVFVLTYDGQILDANAAATEQTGYSLEELAQLNMMRDLPVEEPPLTYETIIESLRRGETVRFGRGGSRPVKWCRLGSSSVVTS